MSKNITSVTSSSIIRKTFWLSHARIAKIKDSSHSETKLEYHASLVSTHNIETLKPSDRSPIVRIQYYQKPFKSIGMAMTTGLLI